MITLCGFAVSNYFNIVKQVLLEKEIAFTEEHVTTGSKDAAVLADSPLAKIPFIRTPQGGLCESAVILDYLEAQYPTHPLMPSDPFAAAKLRELITFINLHLELVARELYGQAFFGGTVSEATQASVRKRLEKNIAAFKRMVKFSPYIGGDTFTLATRAIFGEDLLIAGGLDYKAYTKMLGERASSQKVNADRKAALTKP